MTQTEAKRRHHYVWKHYLKPWAPSGRLWCQRDGKVFTSHIGNIGLQSDFYRLREMSPRDVDFVNALVRALPDHARDLVVDWLPMFTGFFTLKRLHQQTGIPNPRLDAALEVAVSNAEEELHAHIERGALPLLSALQNGDASFLQEADSALHFFWFIATQTLRTPRMVKSIESAFGDDSPVNAEAVVGPLRTIFSTTMGASLTQVSPFSYPTRRAEHEQQTSSTS